MTLAEIHAAKRYAAKRAANECTQCRNPATDGTLCHEHRLKARMANSQSRKRIYLRKKLAGICVNHGCHSPAREDAVWCQPCTEKIATVAHARNKTRRRKETSRAAQRRYRKKRIALGLCTRCNEPLTTETLCERHRREHQTRFRARKGPVTSKVPCTSCGEIGHRAQTCRWRPQDKLRIEDYATERKAWAA